MAAENPATPPSPEQPSFYCYILKCADGTYYTGWTTDPVRREKTHNRGQGARYTRMHRPVSLVYVEEFANRSAAMKREICIKKLTRQRKEQLVSQFKLKEKDG